MIYEQQRQPGYPPSDESLEDFARRVVVPDPLPSRLWFWLRNAVARLVRSVRYRR